MIGFLLKDFIRSRSLVAGISLLLFTGLVSLYVGGLFLERQEDTMAQTAAAQEEGIERTLDFVADNDLGLFLYYARFGLVNELPRLAGLSVGHRDVHPAAQNVNIRNLEEQRHVSVLRNPLYQLLGNLDFSFVLVFLFPLVIIAFCFNLFSEEREGGTWSLVLSQAERPELVLFQKLFLRFAAVQITLLSLLVLAVFYLRIPVDAYFLAFASVAFLYVTFWFSLAWLVVRLGRSSSENALALLLAWVLLTIVAPGALNAVVSGLYPVPEAYEALLESRDGYHNKWDEPKEPTLTKFKEIYPQFADYEHPEGANFGWLWYYAMQHLGDAEAESATTAMREKLEGRDSFSRLAGYFIPSVHAQLSLNTLGRADLTNHLAFQDRLAEFHEAKRLGFYPQVFAENAISTVNWEEYGTEYFRDSRGVNWLATLLPLLLASILLLVVSRMVGVP
ncbi:MAG: DUF3526 domain-containing protein, partial [Bacteroidota bacterium]